MSTGLDKQRDAAALLSWYGKNRRILPWREDPSPYHVWLSEIMLQQTRVEAVIHYYERFTAALPDIAALAAADEELCLKLWEGLGYYSRVRNMRRAAAVITEQYSGRMPDTFEGLLSLPGIGRYTAAAVSSIAFGRKEPAVDGNLLRIYARLAGYGGEIRSGEAFSAARSFYLERMDSFDPAEYAGNAYGDMNQALMDLGAMVCTPGKTPYCAGCPLSDSCRALREGRTADLPVMSARKERRVEDRTVFVLRAGDRFALRRRPSVGLLAGMYELPGTAGHLKEEEAVEYLKRQNLSPLRIRPLGAASHFFSHVEWHMTGYEVRLDEFPEADRGPEDYIFVRAEEIKERYPVPEAFRAYRKRITGE